MVHVVYSITAYINKLCLFLLALLWSIYRCSLRTARLLIFCIYQSYQSLSLKSLVNESPCLPARILYALDLYILARTYSARDYVHLRIAYYNLQIISIQFFKLNSLSLAELIISYDKYSIIFSVFTFFNAFNG